MIIVLSPAKTLDFESSIVAVKATQPDFLEQSQVLVDVLRKFSPQALASLMGISDKLAFLNAERYATWSQPLTPDRARPAVLAFNGDVYEGLQAGSLGKADLQFAQKHLRILSGLYGVLRPLDLMLPYRLEMGTKLANPRGVDLYAFWGERIAVAINAAVAAAGAKAVVNLASDEYFRSVQPKALAVPVIQPVFEDWSGNQASGKFKVVSFYAKRARGLMARFAITQRIKSAEGLKDFADEGYAFDAKVSGDARWVFRRKLDK